MAKEDGGSAFPVVVPENWKERADGMTLRDWFAGMAMQGLLANGGMDGIDVRASHAYATADAMLRARKEQSNG